MPVVSDLYVPGRSWAHAVDPRVKLVFVASFIVLVLVFDNVFFMLSVLALTHIVHWSAGIPARRLAFIWKTLLPVAVLMAVLWTLFYPSGESLIEIWKVRITGLGLVQGAVLGLRLLSMAFVVFAWLYTTDQTSLVLSMVRLRMPYEWGLVLSLALRYIPTFQATYALIADAQAARGLQMAGGAFARVRRMMPIFIAMIITSLRASEQLARALEARALGAPGVRRTSLRTIAFRPLDYGLSAAILAMSAGLLYLNVRYGIGEGAISWVPGHDR